MGLVGLGRVGSHVARRLLNWDVRLLAADPYVSPGHAATLNTTLTDLGTLLAESDVVSLHCTLPDETLLKAATDGTLRNPVVFDRQLKRMLIDARSRALATRFAAQWLRLQDLDKVEPDALSFPYFDELLAESMTHETTTFFSQLVRDDRPLLEYHRSLTDDPAPLDLSGVRGDVNRIVRDEHR